MIKFEFKINDKIEYQYDDETVILTQKNLNTILDLIANEILNKGVNKNGYVDIHSSKFSSAFERYEPYLSYLLRYEMVERDYYIKNEKPYGYRFTELFKGYMEISKIYYNTDLNENPKNIQEYDSTISINKSVYHRLTKDFLNAQVIYYPQKEQIEKTKDEWDNFININKWLYNNTELCKWKKRYVFFKWSRQRLYTNFVNLSSHVRAKNIKLNNEKIVEFDITSSFPLMLAQFCLKQKPEIFEDYEFRKYCTAVIEGKFYNELMAGLNSIRNCTKGDKESDVSTRLLSKKEAKTLLDNPTQTLPLIPMKGCQ